MATQAFRVQPRPLGSALHELATSHQNHHGVGEPEGDDQVDDRRQAQDEGESADAADGQEVQHHGGEQRDKVRRQQGAAGAHPSAVARLP